MIRDAVEFPTYLYRLYDAAGVLLYVGITSNIKQRMARHAVTNDWWPSVARIETKPHGLRADAEDAERAAIIAERPLRNTLGTGRPYALPTPRRVLDWTDPHAVARAFALDVSLPAVFTDDRTRNNVLGAIFREAQVPEAQRRRIVVAG